jgi:hypothetical protein
LDEREGVSYPDGQQLEEGAIYIIFDYNRIQEQYILMTQCTEEEVLSGDTDAVSIPEPLGE